MATYILLRVLAIISAPPGVTRPSQASAVWNHTTPPASCAIEMMGCGCAGSPARCTCAPPSFHASSRPLSNATHNVRPVSDRRYQVRRRNAVRADRDCHHARH